ncbi:TetR/AcrR family transcriptional regulator [Puia dinghuensis]|uniref:TetR family transcriptional regulator n=1 Tax=Puia dinghuensis TaxID=1792502 RepID=A0A8J2UI39_9BACT|nr:TetR family transcriptional regulator [Puia dinghuensis]GGB21257.1 TetR family transcriptional regulator [Puia dinghuensis]
MSKTKIKAKEASTEERIKEAARKLFTQKGFAATRTRDIADEAGINLALLNYYFRSKQKLFDIIMIENFRGLMGLMTGHFRDEQLTMEDKIAKMVGTYIDFISKNPDLPLFVLSELQGNPSAIAARINQEFMPARTQLFKELQESNREGKTALEPFHFVANLIGLTIFPFIARPILQRTTQTTDEQFAAFMQERRTLVPMWIRMMMKPPGK